MTICFYQTRFPVVNNGTHCFNDFLSHTHTNTYSLSISLSLSLFLSLTYKHTQTLSHSLTVFIYLFLYKQTHLQQNLSGSITFFRFIYGSVVKLYSTFSNIPFLYLSIWIYSRCRNIGLVLQDQTLLVFAVQHICLFWRLQSQAL